MLSGQDKCKYIHTETPRVTLAYICTLSELSQTFYCNL